MNHFSKSHAYKCLNEDETLLKTLITHSSVECNVEWMERRHASYYEAFLAYFGQSNKNRTQHYKRYTMAFLMDTHMFLMAV